MLFHRHVGKGLDDVMSGLASEDLGSKPPPQMTGCPLLINLQVLQGAEDRAGRSG